MATEETLFNQALALDPSERRAFLDRACGSDADLRRSAEALLRAHLHADAFLSSPPALADDGETRDLVSAPAAAGTRIGEFKILEKIGEGGMGDVYMAEQQKPIRRIVAVKVIKPGMDTRQVIARFEAERQALAMMDHPSIARIFDAGTTETGLPYFVMELVKGIPITAYCDQHQLPPKKRLELFILVCQAVQHAHQKGIIHRDLKPNNILITFADGDKPIPKIIDFGIAKAVAGQRLTEQTLYTELRQLVGTPLYMSPEQAEMSQLMDVDTRSDIYSLGVLLYELLTGTTPFDKKRLAAAGLDALRKIIREEEPPAPSTRLSTLGESLTTISAQRQMDPRKLAQSLKGELDWIVMKALDKDRARRYPTATSFAADVEHYLSNQPVEACPPSRMYRLRKTIRRNKAAVLVAGAIVGLLLLGVTATGVLFVKARANLAEAVEAKRALLIAADDERRARDDAVQGARQATRQLADNYTARGLDTITSRNAEAALWFANAAMLARDDPEGDHSNLVRMKNWLEGQWVPVAAVGQRNGSGDKLAFDPGNSRYLVTFQRNQSDGDPPRLWDLATEQTLPPPPGLTPLSDVAWTDEGEIVMGSATGSVVLASIPDLKVLAEWNAGAPVQRIAISKKGGLIAAASGSRLLLWNLSDKAAPAVIDHPDKIAYIAFAPTGRRLLTATEAEAQARVFAVQPGASAPPKISPAMAPVIHIIRHPAGTHFARFPAFVNGENELCVIDKEETIRFYDILTGTQVAEAAYSKLSPHPLRCFTVSPDGHTMAIGSQLYDAQEHRPDSGNFVNVVRLSPVDTVNLNIRPSGSFDNCLGQAFSADGDSFATVNLGVSVFRRGGTGWTRSLPIVPGSQPAFSHDGQYLAVLSEGGVKVWRVPAAAGHPETRVAVDGSGSRATFSPDGKFMAPIGKDRGTTIHTLQVTETATCKPAGKPLSLGESRVGADFSPDSKCIAVVTGERGKNGQLQLWNWESGSQVWEPVRLDSEPVSTCFAPDGKVVAVHCIDGTALLIDAATGRVSLPLKCAATRPDINTGPWAPGRATIGFSRDGKTVLTWGSKIVQGWNRDTGKETFRVVHSQACWACAESPVAPILATAGRDNFLRLWNTAVNKEVQPPLEHPDQVLSVDFSPDGKLVATTCLDSQARVWDVSTGALKYAIPLTNWLTDARFSPDGCFLVHAGGFGVQVADARTGAAVSTRIGLIGNAPLLDITHDGRWALVGYTDTNSYFRLDLKRLTSEPAWSPEEGLTWSELLSNSRIAGSEVVNLSNAEWLDRWQKYRASHPEFRPLAATGSPSQ